MWEVRALPTDSGFSGKPFLFLGNVYLSPPPNVPQSFHPHDTIAMAAALLMASVLTGMEMHVAWNTTLDERNTPDEPYWRVHVAGGATLMAVQMENLLINVTKLNTATGVQLGSVSGVGQVVFGTVTGFAASGPYFAMVNLKKEVCVHDVDTLQEVWCVGVPDKFTIKGDTFMYSRDRDVAACSTKTGAKLWSATLYEPPVRITIGDTFAAFPTGTSVSVFHVDTGVLAYRTNEVFYTAARFVFDAANNMVASRDHMVSVFSPTGKILANYTSENGALVTGANILPDSSLIVSEVIFSEANNNYPGRLVRVDKTGEKKMWDWNTGDTLGDLHLMPERNQLAVVSSGSLEVLSLETGKSVGVAPVFDYQEPGEPADDGEGNIIFGAWGFTANDKKVIFAMSAQLP